LESVNRLENDINLNLIIISSINYNIFSDHKLNHFFISFFPSFPSSFFSVSGFFPPLGSCLLPSPLSGFGLGFTLGWSLLPSLLSGFGFGFPLGWSLLPWLLSGFGFGFGFPLGSSLPWLLFGSSSSIIFSMCFIRFSDFCYSLFILILLYIACANWKFYIASLYY
jgi:hypothetical protein